MPFNTRLYAYNWLKFSHIRPGQGPVICPSANNTQGGSADQIKPVCANEILAGRQLGTP
jgi:hypothetical protein